MSESGSMTDTATGELLGHYQSFGPIYFWWNFKLGWGLTRSRDKAWAKCIAD